MNVLDYEYNSKVKSFFDLIYQRNLIPTINKPTRVGKNAPTAIDHIITDYILTWLQNSYFINRLNRSFSYSNCPEKWYTVSATFKNKRTNVHKYKRSYEEKMKKISNFQSPTTFNQLGWN